MSVECAIQNKAATGDAVDDRLCGAALLGEFGVLGGGHLSISLSDEHRLAQCADGVNSHLKLFSVQ